MSRLSRQATAWAPRLPAPFLLLLAVGASWVPASSPGLTILALAGLLILPGASLLALAGINSERGAARLVMSVAVGIGLAMAAGGLASLFGFLVGVQRPLDVEPLRCILVGLAAFLVALGVRRNRDGLTWLSAEMRVRDGAFALALGLLPVVAILGAFRLNSTGLPDLAIGCAGAVVVLLIIAVIVIAVRPRTGGMNAILFFSVLAIAYGVTARGSALYGWDISKELSVALQTLGRGIWVAPSDADAYASMLSLSVLPAVLKAIGGLDPETAFRYVFPAFLALAVVAGYVFARRFARPGPAFVVIVITAFASGSLVRGLPGIAREEVGLFIGMAMMIVLFDHLISHRARTLLTVTLATVLAFSHYTSSYLMLGILIVAYLFVRGLPLIRRRAAQPDRHISLWLLIGVATVTLGWNALATRSIVALDNPFYSMDTAGLALLPTGTDPIETWLKGAIPDSVPVAAYRTALVKQLAPGAKFDWIEPVPAGAAVVLVDSIPPNNSGPLAKLGAPWNLASRLAYQGLLGLIVLSILLAILMALRKKREDQIDSGALGPDGLVVPDDPTIPARDPMPEIVGLGIGSLIIVIILRLSATAAASYNPERAALHAALLYAPLIAVALTLALRRRYLGLLATALVAGLLPVLLLASTGLGAVIFSGPSAASLSASGEEVERFVVSSSEYAAARWLAGVSDTWAKTNPKARPVIVSPDRYGAIPLLVDNRGQTFKVVDWVDPAAVDRGAFIYASATNLTTGRARGLIGLSRSTFLFPFAFYDATRAIVYSSDGARIYR